MDMKPEYEKKLDDLHKAIVGDPQYGHKGLVHRITEVEKIQAKHVDIIKQIRIMTRFGTPVVSAFFIVVWEYIKSKF